MSRNDSDAVRRQKLIDMLIDHDANDPDVLREKIEKLYGRTPALPGTQKAEGC